MLRFLIILFLFFPIFGEIITSPTAETLIKKGEGPFWLVVDLDNTLFESKEALGHADWYDELLQKELSKGTPKPEAIAHCYKFWIASQKVNHVQPVEECLLSWIQELQQKGTPVLALTSRHPIIQTETKRQLDDLRIDFSKTAPKADLVTSFDHPAKYVDGVLYISDLNDKGTVFSAFLADNQLKPQKVLFIDDKLYNVRAIENVLSEKGIEVVALHYTALAEREPIYNKAIADFQYQKLYTLLSNDEALLLLHHQPDIHQ